MPFTPSHAVVALPFLRTPLLPAAIVVGAMAPDLPLFVRGTPLSYSLTHSNVVVAVVLAFALLALWYGMLRPAVRELSPLWLARRLPPEWDATARVVWRSLRAGRGGALFALLVALSLLIGVVSHIVWDAFTHAGRWGIHLVPALADQWGPLEGYRWLQHASSAFGLLALGVFGALWLRGRHPDVALSRLLPDYVRVLLWLALPLCLLLAWFGGLAVYGPLGNGFTMQHLAYQVLPVACAVWGGLAVVSCGLVLLARARHAR